MMYRNVWAIATLVVALIGAVFLILAVVWNPYFMAVSFLLDGMAIGSSIVYMHKKRNSDVNQEEE